ncbi:MAG: agmatinase [Methanosarcinales archaeon]|nr:agmatinase [Methanosarcinales archaeon]
MSDNFFFADADSSYEDAIFIIFGAPFDYTSTYRKGSRLAPDIIREVSYSFETYNPFFNVDLCNVPMHDAGNIEISNNCTIEQAITVVGNMVRKVIAQGKIPIMLGGEHSLTLPCIRETKLRYHDLGAVVLDAHLDLLNDYSGERNSHACISRRIIEDVTDEYVSIGIRSGSRDEYSTAKTKNIIYYTADQIYDMGCDNVHTELSRYLNTRHLYLSLDMDVLDPSFAPALGTPEPFGLTDRQVLSFIRKLAPRTVGFDVVEIAPQYDSGNTALLGAKFIREFIAAVWAYKEQNPR